MGLEIAARKRIGCLEVVNHAIHVFAGVIGVAALVWGALGHPFAFPPLGPARLLVDKVFYVNAGAIGLLAIDFAYLGHFRSMRDDALRLLRVRAGVISDANAPELFAILTSLTAYVLYHALVFGGLMFIMGAFASVLPTNSNHDWRFIVLAVGTMVAGLHFLHYWTTHASVMSIKDLLRHVRSDGSDGLYPDA